MEAVEVKEVLGTHRKGGAAGEWEGSGACLLRSPIGNSSVHSGLTTMKLR